MNRLGHRIKWGNEWCFWTVLLTDFKNSVDRKRKARKYKLIFIWRTIEIAVKWKRWQGIEVTGDLPEGKILLRTYPYQLSLLDFLRVNKVPYVFILQPFEPWYSRRLPEEFHFRTHLTSIDQGAFHNCLIYMHFETNTTIKIKVTI